MRKDGYMKTEFLKSLGLEDEAISKIMAENGKDIEKEKAKATAANEALEAANKKVEEYTEKLSNLEGVSGDAEKYKKELEDLKAQIASEKEEAKRKAEAAKIAAEYKERFTGLVGEKKWRDELTEKAVYSAFKEALADESNKGKGDKEIFEELTKDRNYYENPNPLDMSGMGGIKTGGGASEADILRIMGVSPEGIKELTN